LCKNESRSIALDRIGRIFADKMGYDVSKRSDCKKLRVEHNGDVSTIFFNNKAVGIITFIPYEIGGERK
jgi:hypothetical protein